MSWSTHGTVRGRCPDCSAHFTARFIAGEAEDRRGESFVNIEVENVEWQVPHDDDCGWIGSEALAEHIADLAYRQVGSIPTGL